LPSTESVAETDEAAAGDGDNMETATSAPLPLPKPGREPLALERPMPATRADGRRVIVIDPGHGGIDPGAVGVRRTKEKDVVLAFSRALRERLQEEHPYRVVLN